MMIKHLTKHGNSQTITVTDKTAPAITGVGGPQTIECPATPAFSSPTASDLCDPSPTVTFADVTTPGSCAQSYNVTRTWTATDYRVPGDVGVQVAHCE